MTTTPTDIRWQQRLASYHKARQSLVGAVQLAATRPLTTPAILTHGLRQPRRIGAIEFRDAPKTGGYHVHDTKGPAP